MIQISKLYFYTKTVEVKPESAICSSKCTATDI